MLSEFGGRLEHSNVRGYFGQRWSLYHHGHVSFLVLLVYRSCHIGKLYPFINVSCHLALSVKTIHNPVKKTGGMDFFVILEKGIKKDE